MTEKVAVYPGSFDPITRGHESIIRRALLLFDQVIVAIGENGGKNPFFPLERRLSWLEEIFRDEPRIRISTYNGLTIDPPQINPSFIRPSSLIMP